ncbi:FTR1 family iron permease [Neobacillus sp. Marseille-QA0830]
MNGLKKVKHLLAVLAAFLVFFQLFQPAAAAANHDELFVLIGDSLMKAKEGDRETVAKNINQFAELWNSIRKPESKQAKKVDQELKEVQRSLADGNTANEELSEGLSALSSSVVLYDEEQNPVDKAKGREQVQQLLPLISQLSQSIKTGNQTALTSQYQAILNQWNTSEKIVHDESIAAYGNIEKYMALIRIAITQDPADITGAEQNTALLKQEVENFMAGKTAKQIEGNYTLTDLANLFDQAIKEISDQNYSNASSSLNEILNIWPMVEGDVQTRDNQLYSDIETKVPSAISLLNSEKVDAQKATDIVKDLNSRLAPLTSKTDYSFWDAALILLREGLEALLIVATLMAFLKKMGQQDKQRWIWTGVAIGIAASAGLAVVINLVFSKIAAASSREYIEGITGIVAVIMMLTIGAWLHNKSSIGNWNKFINQQMQQAIAKGSLFSFSFISFLSVFREGAETIIFYAGITPYISLQQLVIGVAAAIIILVIVGFVIINYSVKIPIRLFFKAATILIYILAFKILGISIHALQISNVLPTSSVQTLPFVDWLGLYPTWETTITQLVLILIIVAMTWLVKKRTITAGNIKEA